MLSLHVACNDPDNGLFQGYADQLAICGNPSVDYCEFEPIRSSPRFAELEEGIRLSGKVWPIQCAADWVGNWCWNSYQIGDGARTPRWWMADFVVWLRAKRNFTMTMGHSDLFEWFNNPGTSAAMMDVYRWLGEMD